MTARPSPLVVTPLLGYPQVAKGDDLADLTMKALQHNGIDLVDGDILVISSKIASKALGLTAPAADRDEVVRSQTVRAVAERMSPSGVTRVVESSAGPVMAAAGVDASNTGDESSLLTLPHDPDAVAARIRTGVQDGWARLVGDSVHVGVILSDTAGRPWRIGQVDFALGADGIHLVDDLRGTVDGDGRTLAVTERCVGDEIAAAADLVKGKATGIPVAHIRGLGQYVRDGKPGYGARGLVRTGSSDWFGYGAAEAIRSALGVEPGSAEATLVGIASVGTETVAVKASRAMRVALLSYPRATGNVDGPTIRLMAEDDFMLGHAAARIELALRGEGLTSTITRSAPPLADGGLTVRRTSIIVFQ